MKDYRKADKRLDVSVGDTVRSSGPGGAECP